MTNIYETTKRKIDRYPIDEKFGNTKLIEDNEIFLNFVEIERAVQTNDFEKVASACSKAEQHLRCKHLDWLCMFPYHYVAFIDGLSAKSNSKTDENGWTTHSTSYSGEVDEVGHLIHLWAWNKYKLLEADFREWIARNTDGNDMTQDGRNTGRNQID